MMSSYQERLDTFAEGRKFVRMSRPLRNRADGWCDACGSVQARVLFGIKDEHSGQISFVGERCLQQLAERGAVVRRFSKENADEAYAVRYERRGEFAAPAPAVVIEAATAITPSPAVASASPQLLTALLILATPGSDRGMPPKCLSLRLDGEPASQTIALLQSWPTLQQQLQMFGLDRASSTEPRPTRQSSANREIESGSAAPARLPRANRRPAVHATTGREAAS